MKKLNISCERLEGYDNIFLLNGFRIPLKPLSFYKYTPLRRIVSSLEGETMTFISPNKWDDPCETVYLNTDFSEHGYNAESVACMCVSSKSTTNEAACWKLYATPKEGKTLRISYDKERFIAYLSSIARSYGLQVYIGRALYYSEEDIKSISKTGTPLNQMFCPDIMQTYHYLSMLLLKRLSFAYENEVRIFLVAPTLAFDVDSLFKVHCNYMDSGIITQIMIEPFPNPNIYSNFSENEESKQIKKQLGTIVSCKVLQSRLYEKRHPVKKL